MKKHTTDNKNRLQLIWRAVTITFLLAALCGASFYAWFCFSKKTAATVKISDPTAIFINAGNKEDIRYLNLADLDVQTGEYKDYVFCVRGYVHYYRLQLAYTTNNQFSYEIYPAVEKSTEAVPNDAKTVTWIANTGANSGSELTYYSTESALTGSILNQDTNITNEVIAKTAHEDYYYQSTYGLGNNTFYDNRQKYAVPLYWQANTTRQVLDGEFTDDDNDGVSEFCHYYILRIKWDYPSANRENNKETDIIYISAKNFTD